METFFDQITNQHTNELPFVIYNKPNELVINGVLQGDTTIHATDNYTESGFVFAPFDDREKSILIPFDNCIIANFELAEVVEKEVETTIDTADKLAHCTLVEKGILAIKANEFHKVVLSRKEKIVSDAVNPIELFKKAIQQYPTAFVYLWYHPEVGCWLGATPEVLLKTRNNQFKTMALAGTQLFAEDLIWEHKEQEEQQIVTDYITNNLNAEKLTFAVSEPHTVQAGHLAHIQTDISGRLSNISEESNLKKLISVLHPTPAVCGFPKEKAKEFILQKENYNRTFYTGFLGELNKETRRKNNRRNTENHAYRFMTKSSDLYVNLRCMQLHDKAASIYVGGGVTASSVAENECEETCNKTKTMKKLIIS